MEELERRRRDGKPVEDKDPDSEDEIYDNWDATKVTEDDFEDSEDEDPDPPDAVGSSQDRIDPHDGDDGEGVINDPSSQSTGEPPPPPRRSGIKRPLVPYDSTSDEEEEEGEDVYHPPKKAKRSPMKRRNKERVKEQSSESSESSEGSSESSTRSSSPVEAPPEVKEEIQEEDPTEFDMQDPNFLVIPDDEKVEKIDYFPIRTFPPGTFCLPKDLAPSIISPGILNGPASLDATASSENPEIQILSSEEPAEKPDESGAPENPEEYYKIVDSQQIVSIEKFRKAFFPRFSLMGEDEDEERFIKRIFFEPTPPTPWTASKTTEQLDEEERVYWQEASESPETLEREKFRLIKITTRKRPLGKVMLTMQETEDSPITVDLLEDHVAFMKVLDVASYFLIEKLVLDMLKVNTEKYINYLSETTDLLPIRYLDWWNYKPLNTPYRYSGYQLNRFLKRCDTKHLRKLRVRFDKWTFDTLTDARKESSHWRSLREFETNMRLQSALQGCLHFNNLKIKVHELHVTEWEPLLEAFRKKLPICPPPSFDIQTETDIMLTPFTDEDCYYELPLYVHADMFTSSLHTLLVKIDKNCVSGRVIDKVRVEELPEIVDWVFSDDFDQGDCE